MQCHVKCHVMNQSKKKYHALGCGILSFFSFFLISSCCFVSPTGLFHTSGIVSFFSCFLYRPGMAVVPGHVASLPCPLCCLCAILCLWQLYKSDQKTTLVSKYFFALVFARLTLACHHSVFFCSLPLLPPCFHTVHCWAECWRCVCMPKPGCTPFLFLLGFC